MKKQAKARETELDRINRKAKADFGRYMDEYLESPEFEMCEVAKRVYWAVEDLIEFIDPMIPSDETTAIAQTVKKYRTWVQRQERDADALIKLAMTNVDLARGKLDDWESSLAGESPEYDELVTEIRALGKSEHSDRFDTLRGKLRTASCAFLKVMRTYLAGKQRQGKVVGVDVGQMDRIEGYAYAGAVKNIAALKGKSKGGKLSVRRRRVSRYEGETGAKRKSVEVQLRKMLAERNRGMYRTVDGRPRSNRWIILQVLAKEVNRGEDGKPIFNYEQAKGWMRSWKKNAKINPK